MNESMIYIPGDNFAITVNREDAKYEAYNFESFGNSYSIWGDEHVISKITEHTPVFESELAADKVFTINQMIETLAPALRTNGYPVLQKRWKFVNNTTDYYKMDNMPYNSSNNTDFLYLDNGDYRAAVTYYQGINRFANFKLGLITSNYTNNSGVINNPIITVGWLSSTNVPQSAQACGTQEVYIPCTYHVLYGSNRASTNAKNDSFRFYTHNGTDISFLSFYNLDRCVAFIQGRSLDNPNNVKSAILVSGTSDNGEYYTSDLPPANYIDIFMDDSRVPTTYTSNICDYAANNRNFILYKFCYKGYSFDSVYTYTGTLPANHFFIGTDEYFKIGLNVLLKL